MRSSKFLFVRADAVRPVLGLRPWNAMMSIPLATFLAKPSAKAVRYCRRISSAPYLNSSDTLMPYSTLTGTIVIDATVPPPFVLAPFSPTRSTSLSSENVKTVSPLNGIGSAPESLARELLPLTLLNISFVTAGGSNVPLVKMSPIIFLLN